MKLTKRQKEACALFDEALEIMDEAIIPPTFNAIKLRRAARLLELAAQKIGMDQDEH